MQNILVLYCFFIILTSCSFGQKYESLSMQKIETIFRIIKNLYVDTINDHQLIDATIISLLQQLDPHSDYITPEESVDMTESLEGNFEGIGVQFSIVNDTLYIIQVIQRGPSERAGIIAGDRIIKINDTVITGKGMRNKDILNRLRGPKGTIVTIEVIRNHYPYPKIFKIIRDQIPICSLEASYMLDKETGYIKLSRFGAMTHKEFKKALIELEKKGLKNLILDLQDNGGGYIQSATDITNEFLKKNTLIVYTEGAHQTRQNFYASIDGSFLKGKIVILINEFTASASEIVAGALQDWDRALIIGRRSFGKGLVQHPISFADGSMLRLTTARYYTPTGRSIQKPYEKGNKELYEKDLTDRYNRGEMSTVNSIHFPDSLKYYTLVNKRTVYGGGGIMPDYFIPIDTSQYTNFHRSLISSGIINQFVINYIDKNRSFIQNVYPRIDIYKLRYSVSESMIKELLKSLKEKNVELIDFRKTEENIKQFKKSSSLIKSEIKALIAFNIWGANEYYQIINEENEIIRKAAEIIKDSNKYHRLLKSNENDKMGTTENHR